MYHDPLNTQIMIAIERFHLFSPAAHIVKKKVKQVKHQQRQLEMAGSKLQQPIRDESNKSSSSSNSSINDKYCTPITVL